MIPKFKEKNDHGRLPTQGTLDKGNSEELSIAAGSLLRVPQPPDLPRYPCAEIPWHCDDLLNVMRGYILCGK